MLEYALPFSLFLEAWKLANPNANIPVTATKLSTLVVVHPERVDFGAIGWFPLLFPPELVVDAFELFHLQPLLPLEVRVAFVVESGSLLEARPWQLLISAMHLADFMHVDIFPVLLSYGVVYLVDQPRNFVIRS